MQINYLGYQVQKKLIAHELQTQKILCNLSQLHTTGKMTPCLFGLKPAIMMV